MFDGLGIDKDFLNNGMPLNMGNLDGMSGMLGNIPKEHQDKMNDMFENEMKSMGGEVDFKLWMKIIELQKEFNDRVSPGWEKDINQEQFQTWTAILDETVEVIGSKHWKWWKDTQKINNTTRYHIHDLDCFPKK